MNLSKLNRKYKDCLGPSSIAQSLTDNSCYRQLWLQYRFKSESQDSIFLERYKLQHASSLNILKNNLQILYADFHAECNCLDIQDGLASALYHKIR